MSKPFVIGLAGGSGSGKSTLADGIEKTFAGQAVTVHLDHYFIEPSQMPVYAGQANYDDPRSVKIDLLMHDINKLIHSKNHALIIIEGILVLWWPELRQQLNLSVFLMAPHHVTINRRVHDASDHYREQVIRPMYEKYIEPTAGQADLIFDVEKMSKEAILDEVIKNLQQAHPGFLKTA